MHVAARGGLTRGPTKLDLSLGGLAAASNQKRPCLCLAVVEPIVGRRYNHSPKHIP